MGGLVDFVLKPDNDRKKTAKICQDTKMYFVLYVSY